MTRSVALVTGAAGGIGAAVARALAAQGTAVAAVDRDAEGLRAVVAALTSGGAAARAFPCDITDPGQVEDAVASIETRMGELDRLVNAAGILRAGSARELSEKEWSETLAVNTTGVFLVSRAAVGAMVPRGRGAVVTVASNAAGTARTGMSAYSASKAAAAMFTKCLGLEVAEHGIRCNVVAPGSTDTPMLRDLYGDGGPGREAVAGKPEAFRVGIPLGRLAQPADIAAAVAFLLSEGAAHITMHSLTVDGGATLGL